MNVEQLLPEPRALPVLELADRVRASADRLRLQPFDPEVVGLFSSWSQRLVRDPRARRFPEIMALGYWMRRSELARLGQEFAALATARTVIQPRGLVFHLPPSNVDTLFVYSWLLSALLGNHNVVRISRRTAEQGGLLLEVLSELLSDPASEAVRASTTLVRYGHEAPITEALSAVCDARVIWGGDETIRAVRAIPLPAHAAELTFADRDSLAVVDPAAYLALDPSGRDEAVRRFHNDAYWFDQAACSSPRAVVWVGEASAARAAGEDWFARLDRELLARGYRVETGTALKKQLLLHQLGAEGLLSHHRWHRNELLVLGVAAPWFARARHVGGGVFVECRVDSLAELVPHLGRRDQTLATLGLPEAALRDLVRRLAGRGVDRIVPLGEALTFNRYWDGLDLLQSFGRRVYLQAAAQEPS